MINTLQIIDPDQAVPLLRQGRILAYPTEAVYGLGCDPFNQTAVESLIRLKGRPQHKGFIVLISDWTQLEALIQPIADQHLVQVKATWPGPVTWIFPKASRVPVWLTGGEETIAIRMTAHPIARALCVDHPLVSTSANLSGKLSARSELELLQQFPKGIDALVAGELGGRHQPSAIYDACTGYQLR
jgi:L-threonylcarbamoyladenylate synthase